MRHCLQRLGAALFNLKRYDEAIETYRKATVADDKFAFAYNNWGLALAAQKKYGPAISGRELRKVRMSDCKAWVRVVRLTEEPQR